LNLNSTQTGYLSLCYHYVRDSNSKKLFPKILGNSVDDFEKHIKMFLNNFELITPENALNFSYGDYNIQENKIGLLITFDDGLSDHYIAAKILAKYGIKALFFIPTCILEENLPANPIIIHYCIAKFGVLKFVHALNYHLEKNLTNYTFHTIQFIKGKDNPMQTIQKIKKLFKYDLSPTLSRTILLNLYQTMLTTVYPDAMRIMHLTKEQISEMLEMGHSIGTHTYSHISVGSTSLSDDEFNDEIVEPKNHLQKYFGIQTDFMSYPFGDVHDCLSSKELIMKTNSYKLAFTVEQIFNTKSTSPFELGRYMPTSMDTSELLYNKMKSMIKI
jgi:peptidoglycan/xylan/chitin deacetylase (PgdA/CDA1 family)